MAPDNIDPEVFIDKIMVNDTADQVTLYGTATDNVAVDSVAWENKDTGGSGACTWVDPDWECDVAVQAGDNEIVITATDTSANTGSETLIVNYTACAGGGTTVVRKVVAFVE